MVRLSLKTAQCQP